MGWAGAKSLLVPPTSISSSSCSCSSGRYLSFCSVLAPYVYFARAAWSHPKLPAFEFNFHRPTSASPTEPLMIAMLRERPKLTYLGDRIETLDRNAVETTPMEQVVATTPAFESGTSLAPRSPTLNQTLIAPQFLLVDLNTPACRRVIRRTFATHELPSLIEAIFSSKDENNMIRCLLRDDAQTFIDVMNEVRPAFSHLSNENDICPPRRPDT